MARARIGAVAPAGECTRPAAARARRVHFLGIGAQKAGTTWLYRMLAAHPQIFMAEGRDKDLRFFNAYYDRGYRWYERHFDRAGDAKCKGEFSTSYFYSKDAPERVYRYDPGVRLILSLRDPVERLISHHRHEIRVGRLPRNVSLRQAVEDNPSYVEQSMYFAQLSRWLEWFPLSSFHILIFEEMFREPAQSVRDLYAFVGAPSSFSPERLHEKVNEGRIPRSLLLDRATGLLSSSVRSMGGSRMLEPLKKAGAHRWLRRGNTCSDHEIGLDESLVERLRAEFAAENARLAAALGRDLSVWDGGGSQQSAGACRNA